MSAARRMLERRLKPLLETSWEDNSSIRYFVLIQRILSDVALFASNSDSVRTRNMHVHPLMEITVNCKGRREEGHKSKERMKLN